MRIVTAVTIMITLQGAALGLENVIAKNLVLMPLFYVLAILPMIAGGHHADAPPERPEAANAAPPQQSEDGMRD